MYLAAMGKKSRLKRLRRELRPRSELTPAQLEQADRVMEQFPDCRVIHQLVAEKMSEILPDFAKPLLSDGQTHDAIRKALGFAALAWNYSIFPLDMRGETAEKIDSLLRDEEVRKLWNFLLERKRRLYPENRRIILDYEIDFRETGLALNVVSTCSLPPGSNGGSPRV